MGAFFIGASTLSSCSKYTEGPGFALSSKTSRLAGSWELSSKTLNGVNVIVTGYSEHLTIEKDGSFTDTAKLTYPNGTSISGPVSGSWSFSEDKLQVIFDANATNNSFTLNGNNTWNIIKLAKDEIKFEKISNNSVTAMTYVPKN